MRLTRQCLSLLGQGSRTRFRLRQLDASHPLGLALAHRLLRHKAYCWDLYKTARPGGFRERYMGLRYRQSHDTSVRWEVRLSDMFSPD